MLNSFAPCEGIERKSYKRQALSFIALATSFSLRHARTCLLSVFYFHHVLVHILLQLVHGLVLFALRQFCRCLHLFGIHGLCAKVNLVQHDDVIFTSSTIGSVPSPHPLVVATHAREQFCRVMSAAFEHLIAARFDASPRSKQAGRQVQGTQHKA